MASSKLSLSLLTWFSLDTVSHLEQHFFLLEQTVLNVLFMYKTLYKHFKLIELIPQPNIIYSYINIVTQTILYPVTLLVSYIAHG